MLPMGRKKYYFFVNVANGQEKCYYYMNVAYGQEKKNTICM
jgi:hypothetical protein